jgi:hypothetical protein
MCVDSLLQLNHEVVINPVSDQYASARRYLVQDVRELALRTYGSKGIFPNGGEGPGSGPTGWYEEYARDGFVSRS